MDTHTLPLHSEGADMEPKGAEAAPPSLPLSSSPQFLSFCPDWARVLSWELTGSFSS